MTFMRIDPSIRSIIERIALLVYSVHYLAILTGDGHVMNPRIIITPDVTQLLTELMEHERCDHIIQTHIRGKRKPVSAARTTEKPALNAVMSSKP